MPHSTLMRDWSSKDVRLAIAHVLTRDDVGPCGHPHSRTTEPGAEDRFEVRDDAVCGACAQLARYRRLHEDDLEPGVLLRVVDTRAPDVEETAFGPVFD